MTFAYIKSNALRRTLIILSLPALPIIVGVVALVKATIAFIEEIKDQCSQGGGGIWLAVCDCWKGVDVSRKQRQLEWIRRHNEWVESMARDTQVQSSSNNKISGDRREERTDDER